MQIGSTGGNLKALPHDPEVKTALMEVIVGTQEVVTYDLSRATISKPLPSMLSVCTSIRRQTLEFILAKDLVAKMTTNDTRATFGGYASLTHWLTKGRPQSIATRSHHASVRPSSSILKEPNARTPKICASKPSSSFESQPRCHEKQRYAFDGRPRPTQALMKRLP
jgi:hypothetical protein